MAGVKKTSKYVTEASLRKETARLSKGTEQTMTLLKGMSVEIKSIAKGMTKVAVLQKQLDEIRGQMKALQRQMMEVTKALARTKKRRKLTEMNLFVKEQLKSGKNFSEAIQAWKAFKASKVVPSDESRKTTETMPP